MKALLFFIIIVFGQLFSCHALDSMHEYVTIHERGDGFGAHVLFNIAAFVYAEMYNVGFCYRPFKEMEHNYDNDPDFIAKKEWLLNFIDNFITIEEAEKKGYRVIPDRDNMHLSFFDQYARFAQNSLEKLKKIFRANKKNADNYFNNNNFNIAVHIRRPNPHDSRIYGTDIPDDHYVKIIDKLRQRYSSRNPLFHIYSQGDYENFTKYYTSPDIILHLNEPVEDTYLGMVFADVLVTGRSSFSYTAGFLSDAIVYYNSYVHAHLPQWISVEALLKSGIEYNLIKGLPNVYINDISEKIGCTWENGRVWDKPLIEKFYSLLPANKFFVAIDVGAQTGCFSLLAKYFPNSKWYAFEPLRDAADALQENSILNDIKNLTIYSKAVTNYIGKATLKLPAMNQWGLATIGSNVIRFNPIQEREIDCITLDSFVVSQNIKKVDFIKLDTQGSELLVLEGAQKLILRDHPIILMANNKTNMKQCNVNKKTLYNFLQKMGYTWESVGLEDILCTHNAKIQKIKNPRFK